MTALLVLLAAAAPPGDGDDAVGRVLHALRKRVAPSVVAIHVSRESDPDGGGLPGRVSAHRDYYSRPVGPVSGVVYGEDGFILTSYFNVSGVIREGGLRVTLADGRTLEGELLGFDERRDVALVKVDARGLPVLPKAETKDLGQGTFLALVGRSPDPQIPTVNLGILSAMNRMEDSAVQTDAEMNYGNAGGALVTLDGRLVGVACNIRPDTVWGQSGGVGFACKVTVVDSILERLKRGERIEAEHRPFLGVRPGEGEPDVEGLQVGEVVPESPAAKAGLRAQDVIVEFDGKKITDFASLREAVLEKAIGDEVTLKVKRKRGDAWRELEMKLTLGGAPER